MPLLRAMPLLSLLASTLVVHVTVAALQWGPCETQANISVPITCATLDVPRDYLANSSATITLNLVKLSAIKQPSKGTILYNPGGPGDGGRNTLVGKPIETRDTIGPYFDIVTWDPRGTGNTLRPDCFADDASATAYNLLLPQASNGSNVGLQIAWAYKSTYALSCAENMQDVGELIGTAFTARDMMRIVDALDEDGLLRYYGQSYGTILGQTVAAMFPDRMDKVVLDGVVNPTQYYNGRSVQQFDSTDAVFDGFLAQCIASPNLCPVARFDQPDLGLRQRVYETLELLKTQPIVNGSYAGYLVGYSEAKVLIATYIYGLVHNWIDLGVALDFLLSRNTSVASMLAASTAPPSPFPADSADSPQAIRCSDTSLRAKSLDEIRPLVGEFYEMSRILGDYIAVLYPMSCTQWAFKAKEVYSGGFDNITTKNPILFVSNTFDPVSSLAGGKNASAGFPGSRLLVQNGYGHSSWGQRSTCTINAINAYFLNGTLPDEGTQCQPDAGLFASALYASANP